MSKLEDAVKRMERAVARLEKAAARVADGDKTPRGALAAAQADYAALLDTTENVATRLDAAILRLDRALEG
jgi:exonuclease VII small subunit